MRFRHLLVTALATIAALGGLCAQDLDSLKIFSVTANPGADASTCMNISWGCDTLTTGSSVLVMKADGRRWKRATKVVPQTELCTCYDGIPSKRANGENFDEDARFVKCGAELTGLAPATQYKYKIVATAADGTPVESDEHFFKTAGAKSWNACIISDFHSYPPLPKRLVAADEMITAVENYKPFDWVLNLGDVCAWGGSYSFWTILYQIEPFKKYMWAGVNGNHDDMTRKYGTSSDFFRYANFVPRNGYEGQEGVCYWFKYGDALFVMLNNEMMRDSADFEKARVWTEKVLTEQGKDARFKIVCEHYQWFFGEDGSTSQFERWHDTFERCGVTLALGGNNHYYARAHYAGVQYVQTPSSDNERGQKLFGELKYNQDKIDCVWNEGPHTVGAMHMSVNPDGMTLVLLDREGNVIDTLIITN